MQNKINKPTLVQDIKSKLPVSSTRISLNDDFEIYPDQTKIAQEMYARFQKIVGNNTSFEKLVFVYCVR